MTYVNDMDSTCAAVIKTARGFVVCFIEIDHYAFDGIPESRVYKDEKEANRKACDWVEGVITTEEI